MYYTSHIILSHVIYSIMSIFITWQIDRNYPHLLKDTFLLFYLYTFLRRILHTVGKNHWGLTFLFSKQCPTWQMNSARFAPVLNRTLAVFVKGHMLIWSESSLGVRWIHDWITMKQYHTEKKSGAVLENGATSEDFVSAAKKLKRCHFEEGGAILKRLHPWSRFWPFDRPTAPEVEPKWWQG